MKRLVTPVPRCRSRPPSSCPGRAPAPGRSPRSAATTAPRGRRRSRSSSTSRPSRSRPTRSSRSRWPTPGSRPRPASAAAAAAGSGRATRSARAPRRSSSSSGCPKELGERGYPVQVNSTYPTGPEPQSDEPFPGTIMRTSADGEQVVAQVGFSPDGQAQEPGGGRRRGGGAPGLPEVPGLPTGELEDFGAAITGRHRGRSRAGPVRRRAGHARGAGRPRRLHRLHLDQHAPRPAPTLVTHDLPVGAVATCRSLGGAGHRSRACTPAWSPPATAATATAKGAGARRHADDRRQRVHDRPGRHRGRRPAGADPGPPRRPGQGARRSSASSWRCRRPSSTGAATPSSGLVQGLRVEIDTDQLHSQLGAAPARRHHRRDPGRGQGAQERCSGGRRAVARGSCSPSATPAPPPTPSRRIEIPRRPDRTRADDGGAGAGRGPAARAAGATYLRAAPGAPADSGSAPTADGDLTGAAPMGSGLPPLNSIPGALTVGGIAPRRRRRHLAAQDRPGRPRRRRLLSARPRQRPARPPKGLTMTTLTHRRRPEPGSPGRRHARRPGPRRSRTTTSGSSSSCCSGPARSCCRSGWS